MRRGKKKITRRRLRAVVSRDASGGFGGRVARDAMSVACEPADYTQHRGMELDVSNKCPGSSSVYLYDLGKRLRAMFSHRQVDPGSAKILSFKERKLRGNTRIVKQ
jgi:hypothetical protein